MKVETIVLVSFEERRSKRVVDGGKTKLGKNIENEKH